MCLKLVDLARLTFGVRHLDSEGRFSFARKPILPQVVKGKMNGNFFGEYDWSETP